MRQPISLTDQEYQYLQMFVHRGKANTRTLHRARVILKVVEEWKDQEIVYLSDHRNQRVQALHRRWIGDGIVR